MAEIDFESSILRKLSTISFLLGHPEEFANFTAKLALSLSIDQLDGEIPILALPDSIKGSS